MTPCHLLKKIIITIKNYRYIYRKKCSQVITWLSGILDSDWPLFLNNGSCQTLRNLHYCGCAAVSPAIQLS